MGRFITRVYDQAPDDGRNGAVGREFVDLDSELDYWRRRYRMENGRSDAGYGEREAAVKLGLDAYVRSHGRSMEDMEEELRACYERTRGASRLDWEQARPVVEAAWRRVTRSGA